MNCGAWCVRHIHNSHGHRLSLKRARQLARTGRHGTYIPDLMNALVELGYCNVRLKQNLKWHELKNFVDGGNDVIVSWFSDLPSGKTPSLADGHYSVAKKLTKDTISIYDPDAEQVITLPRAFFWSRFYDYELDHAGKRTDFLQAAIVARYPRKKSP